MILLDIKMTVYCIVLYYIFILQRYIKLIKRDSKTIYNITKDFSFHLKAVSTKMLRSATIFKTDKQTKVSETAFYHHLFADVPLF